MSVMTLSEAKAHLNITSATSDDELQRILDSAESTIAEKCGPLEPTPTTSRVRGGQALCLPVTPAIALTSVADPSGVTLDPNGLELDSAAGLVETVSGAGFPHRKYTVVYSAGRTELPDDLRLAVLELVRHLWSSSQRGPSQRPTGNASDGAANTLVGAGYLLPNRVAELIADHLQLGFA